MVSELDRLIATEGAKGWRYGCWWDTQGRIHPHVRRSENRDEWSTLCGLEIYTLKGSPVIACRLTTSAGSGKDTTLE
jgi:hypothetical protein